ncbi:hypothetical protein [Sorangium sp. So ce388]|uniref:hypothetical protein n=1 Tax=Sorangium sp. So ce388 TaxID=3133309 RepID=UPI003F5CB3B3
MSNEKNQFAYHLVALIHGDSPSDIADAMERYAARIRSGDVSGGGSPDTLILRQANTDGGEEAFACRMHGVYQAESYEPKPIAMFDDVEVARRFAAGEPLFNEDDNGPGGDLCVMRSDIVLTAWNHVDQGTDPHAEEAT